jgi:hypothetical protein
MKASPAANWKAILEIMPAENMLEEPSPGLFQRQWKVYRKVVDNNYLFSSRGLCSVAPDLGRRSG